MVVVFQGQTLKLIVTDHARGRATLRKISDQDIRDVVQSGTVKAKKSKNKFWVFKALSKEAPNLVVITALINWSPNADQI